MGLHGHPVLMAAEIPALDADEVPVGADQAQHLEIAVDAAQQFARTYVAGVLRGLYALITDMQLNTATTARRTDWRTAPSAWMRSSRLKPTRRLLGDENQVSDGARLAFEPLLRSSQRI